MHNMDVHCTTILYTFYIHSHTLYNVQCTLYICVQMYIFANEYDAFINTCLPSGALFLYVLSLVSH